jgi:hypothetical protein
VSPKLTPEQSKRLTEAAGVLRLSPAFPILEQHLTMLLEDTKQNLMFNVQPTIVPNLQGRAQQLAEIIELLHRKPK